MAAQRYHGDMAAMREAQQEYNAKIKIYNECKALVEDARKREGNAHDKLRQIMAQISEATTDWLELGLVIAGKTVAVGGGLESNRAGAERAANRFTTQAAFFEKMANGKVAELGAPDKALLDRAANLAKNADEQHLRLSQYEKFIGFVPKDVRTWIAGYPGKGAVGDLGAHAKAGKLPMSGAARGVLKGIP